MSADRFFAFARARHAITLARAAGLPRPWTDDAILGTYRFTNVFREQDRVTRWISQHVREPLDQLLERGEIEPWQQVLGMILAREFNRTETLEQIFCQQDLGLASEGIGPFGWQYITRRVSISELEGMMREHCQRPWVTGAYIVKTPTGMDKLAGALWMVDQARLWLEKMHPNCWQTMETLHDTLVDFPYLGGFSAYEVVSDLRWMKIGRDWSDIMMWAYAGPGAIRGLHRVHGRDFKKSLRAGDALVEMEMLLRLSRSPAHWPQPFGKTGYATEGCELPGHDTVPMQHQSWPAWEMREVEHTLCEFDKYERARLGQGRPRGVYR